MKRARTESAPATQTATQALAAYRRGRKRNTGYKASFTKQIGFPRQLTIRHRYVDNQRIVSTTGALSTLSYRCNGMFDPDASAGGHQPMYFDQLTAIYDHFTVIKSKIKLTFTPEGGTSFASFGVFINDDNVLTPATLAGCQEQSSSLNGIMSLTSSDPQVRTSYWSAVKAFGPNPLANDNLQGTSAADPTEQQTWTIYVGNTTATTVNVAVLIEIEYTAVWDELKDLASS